jgi:hypothetical protein
VEICFAILVLAGIAVLYLLVYKASGEKLQEEVFKTPIEKQQHTRYLEQKNFGKEKSKLI